MEVCQAYHLLLQQQWLLEHGRADAVASEQAKRCAQAAQQSLREHLVRIAATPAALGSKRQGLSHKVHAVLHQLYLLSGDPWRLGALAKCVRAWIVDMGAELGIGSRIAARTTFGKQFPYLSCLAQSAHASHTTEDSILQSDQVSLDMSGSLVIPGLMHMISNMVKTMFLALLFWQACIGEQATALATFLHHPWSRERFVATCLQDEYAVFQPLYASFPADLTRWRWGDVEVCLTKLLQLESSLRMAWRLDRLNYHEGRQVSHLSLSH